MKLINLCILFFVAVGLAACYYPQEDYADRWDLTETARDSLDFEALHHYNVNYNFMVVSDSIVLQTGRPRHYSDSYAPSDSLTVREGDRIVVADILTLPEDSVDSVWIKVARDQLTMGWVREKTLLDSVVPTDSISQFIHFFSDRHLIYLIAAIGLLLAVYLVRRWNRLPFNVVHLNDIPSPFPVLLCLVLSASVTIYASIQHFVPSTWVEFYFHPTLNPFGLPLILGLFMASVWIIIVLVIATVDDVFKLLPINQALLYLFALAGVCIVCYLFFSITTLYYVGYPCFLVYCWWALRRLRVQMKQVCVCGRCGKRIPAKGRCPHCGAVNE